MLARHPVVWYIYSPMVIGPIGLYQVIRFHQIVHYRLKAIGDNPWPLRYSKPTGTVGCP